MAKLIFSIITHLQCHMILQKSFYDELVHKNIIIIIVEKVQGSLMKRTAFIWNKNLS